MEKASLLEAVFEVLGLANLLYFILAIFGIHTGAAKKTVPAAKKTVPAAKETVPAAKETVPAANSGAADVSYIDTIQGLFQFDFSNVLC